MMIRISRASSEDAIAILELQKLAYQGPARRYNDFTIPPLMQTIEDLTADFDSKVLLKAQLEGRIIGSVKGYQEGSTCYIDRLMVHPDFQRQGLGTTLMKEIESHFEGAMRFELFTGHRSDSNIRLYERLGYGFFKSEEVHENLSFVFMEKYR
jgi:ribosomal protein S18 acetylase RimI-like enzyme